jgi:hypothetical protein
MLNMLNDYLRLGIEAGTGTGTGAEFSPWPLMLAAALIAATILTRQSDE